MMRSLLVLGRIFRSSATFELIGAAAIVAAVWGLAGGWWALVAFGGFALLKSLDLALAAKGQ